MQDSQKQFFSKTQVLHVLDSEGQQRLLQAAQIKTFPAKMAVVREGDPGDALYIVIQGSALVSIDDLGKSKTIATLGPGSIFGEMAVITNQPRSATVTAQDKLVLYSIPKTSVLSVLKDYPQAKELMAKIGVLRSEKTLEKLLKDD